MEESFAGDEEEVRVLIGRVLDESHVWMLESPRVLEEVGRGRGEGSEPGSRLIWSKEQGARGRHR